MTKVTFEIRDEVLAAIVRALAVKTAGKQAAGGMTDAALHANGFYHFKFNQSQAERFTGYVAKYLPKEFQNTLAISQE